VCEALRALIDAWQEELRCPCLAGQGPPEVHGRRWPEGMRAEVERRLGRTLSDFALR